jgi:hypothetical protein
MNDKEKRLFEQMKQDMWNAAIDAVIAELRIAPPSRIGEAAFLRRIVNMKTLDQTSH